MQMIEDISTSDFKKIYKNDEGYISNNVLKQCKSYFNVNLINASAMEKAQWFKNLFWVTANIDLGLAHSIQHNQSARNYINDCTDEHIIAMTFGSRWEDSIGADVEAKPSSDVIITKHNNSYMVNGRVNWLTNLEVANYATIPVFDNDNNRFKVVIDLKSPGCTIDNSWGMSLGMKMARPSSLLLDNVAIPKSCCMGVYSYPNKFHYSEMLNGLSFVTNMTGNIVAMHKEIVNFAKKNDLRRDMQLIDLENDVFVATKKWLDRLQQFNDPTTLNSSESYWNEHLQTYVFGKKTLLKTINVSRNFGIQHQLFEGESSRVFRNAITFTSHMFKLQNYGNLWGDENNTEVNIDLYIKHSFNKLIDGIDIPETW